MPTEHGFVLDTNVIVSALLSRQSVARQAFDKARVTGRILLSPATVEELSSVLARKGFERYISAEQRMQFLAALMREASYVAATEDVKLCRDPKDDKILNLAVDGHASCIVSGDNDLLVLHPFRAIPILTPRLFLERQWT